MNRKELLRSIKFLLFSLSAGIIELAAFSLLNELTAWSYWPCYLIALTLSVLWNFTLNRRYTFQSASSVPKAMALVFAFYCVFTPLSTWLGLSGGRAGVERVPCDGHQHGGKLCAGVSLRPLRGLPGLPGHQQRGPEKAVLALHRARNCGNPQSARQKKETSRRRQSPAPVGLPIFCR